MRYRLTFENGLFALIDDYAARHFLRQAKRRHHELTRVRGGHVVLLPGGTMVALIWEVTQVDLRGEALGVVLADMTVS